MNWLHPQDSPLSGEQLHQMFDGCGGVVVDTDHMVIHVWNGSQTVNVYTYRGDPCDIWMKDGMDRQDFQAEALAHYAPDQEECS